MALENMKKRSRPIWMRVVVVICVLITGWHIFATFLWIAPASALRELVPGKTLSNYMLPVFGQSWSVFAPEPINGNIDIKVRAVVGEKFNAESTPWVDASAAELDLAHHNLFPPRASIMGLQQATEYKSAFDKLSKEQQEIVAKGYFVGNDWLQRLEKALLGAGAESKNAKASSNKNVHDFMDQEKKTTAYATQVALAVWGPEVRHVQVSVSRQNVTPFKDRHNDKTTPQPIRVVESGWRGINSFPGQDTEHFSDVFSNLNGIK